MADIQLEEFTSHTGKIGGAPALAANGVGAMLTEGREVVTRCVHGVRKGQYGGFTVVVNVDGMGEWPRGRQPGQGKRRSQLHAASEWWSCGR